MVSVVVERRFDEMEEIFKRGMVVEVIERSELMNKFSINLMLSVAHCLFYFLY